MIIRADQEIKSHRRHLDAFLVVVHSLGVSLGVYKTNNKWEWTSLLGEEKKILLRKLPDHFEKILLPAKVNKTRQLWIVSSNVSCKVVHLTPYKANTTD